MGFHFINGNLLDTDVDATKPEALVYAPDAHGDRHLVALEYVVFQAPWIKRARLGHADALRPDVHGDRRAEPL